MKKFAAATFLMLPVAAYAQAGLPYTSESAAACYKQLSGAATKEELLGAIACLKGNAYAGEETVKDFRTSQAALLAAHPDVGAALAALEAQKARRTYVAYRSARNERAVLVVDKAYLGEQARPVADIGAMGAEFIHTSAIFGKDKRVPLKDVAGFSYVEAGNRGIGTFTTRLVDQREIVDKSYQGHYPLKVYDAADNAKWSAVVAFGGTAYYTSYPQRKSGNQRLSLRQEDLANHDVVFLTEQEAKREMAKVEESLELERKAQAQRDQAAREKAEAESAKQKQALAAMAKAPRGTEDACKRTDLNRTVVRYDPDYVEIACQFGGVVQLDGLKGAGWLVVSKTKDKDGVVTDYYIRKAR
ncbi:MAG: hypothetical protein ACRYGO_22535 [Janthinobacterium lividum]